MAVKSVTAENVTEFVANRAAMGSKIASPAEVAVQEAKVSEGAAKAESGIVATGTETVSTAPDPGAQEPTAKKEAPKNSVQERINELTREKKELEEFAEGEYEARIQAQRRIAELEALTTKEAPKEPEDPRPDRTKYKAEESDKYEDDLLAWNRRQALKEFQRESERRAAETEIRRKQQEARAEFEDFDDVIARADRTQTVPANLKGILNAVATESEQGVKVVYHLAKNPEEARKLFALSPANFALALGRIELQYMKNSASAEAKTSVPPPPPVTKAPPPMASLSGGEGTVVHDMSQPMAFKDYKSRRMAEIRRKRS